MRRWQGFTLVEILIVVAVMGILLAAGATGYGDYVRWRTVSLVRDAASQVAQDVERVRSEAKRTNSTKSFSITATLPNNTYSFTCGSTTCTGTLPTGATIASITGNSPQTICFQGIYGTQSTFYTGSITGCTTNSITGYYDIVVRSSTNSTITKTVRILGPLGRVYIL